MTKAVTRSIFLFSILITLSTLSAKEPKKIGYTKYVKEITSAFAKDMEKRYKLYCSGGGGQYA